MNYIFTLFICLLMSTKVFSIDVDSDSTMVEGLHYSDLNKYKENDHLVSIIVHELASAKLSSKNSNYQSSYEHSRQALTAALLLNQDDEERPDLLFLSLFSHIVSCDQLGLLEEGLNHLFELMLLTKSLELDYESADDEIIAFEYLSISFDHLDEGVIKEELLKISEIFRQETNSSFSISPDKIQKHLKTPEGVKKKKKPFWKRSYGWWKKQII